MVAFERAVAELLFTLVQTACVLFAQVQHVEHRLLREELEAADALLVVVIDLHRAKRLVFFEGRFAALQQIELAVLFGVLQLLAVLLQAVQALFDDEKIAEDELGLHVDLVADWIYAAVFVRDGFGFKDAENVGQRVHDAKTGEVTGIAERLFGNGVEVKVFHRCIRDLGRLEERGQGFEARVRHLRHAYAGAFMLPGQNSKKGGLSHHGEADDCCLHRGTSTRVRISCRIRSARSELRCDSAVRVFTITRCAKMGTTKRLMSSGMA